MKYTFVHLSDLHFSRDWPEETGLICKKFAEDIKHQIVKNENTFVVFSGDLVYSADEPEAYTNFLQDFSVHLEAAGLPCE